MTLKSIADRQIKALWIAGFYNLDQQFALGEAGRWIFFNTASDAGASPHGFIAPEDSLVFCNTLLSRGNRPREHERTATVVGIEHGQLGALTKVTTDMFGQYEFFDTAGRVVICEAEQDPGINDAGVDDWVLTVELEQLSDAAPLPPHAERLARSKAEGTYREGYRA